MGPNPFFQNPAAQQARLPQFQDMGSYQSPFLQQAGAQQPDAPTGANRQGMQYRKDRRQQKAAGTYDPNAQPEMAPAATGASRAGMQYRKDRRQQKQAGLYDPNAQAQGDGSSLYEQQQGIPQQAIQQFPGMGHNYQLQSPLGQWMYGGYGPPQHGVSSPYGGGWGGNYGMMQPMNFFGGWRGY